MDLDNQFTDPGPAASGRTEPTPPLSVLCVAGGLALIATVIAAVAPAFMGTWQAQFGIRADQAAFVAATEFFAQVAGAGIFPFQFTLIAKADSTGAASATVPAVDTLGLASGAALAGLCVRSSGIIATGWMWAAGSIIGISLLPWPRTDCATQLPALKRRPQRQRHRSSRKPSLRLSTPEFLAASQTDTLPPSAPITCRRPPR